MASASDVPGRYDIVINSVGYCFYRPADQGAKYGYSPTFIERTNVEGDYGDDQQAFWHTFTQNDWSVGEGQQFAHAEGARPRRYYAGASVDVRVPGKVTMRPAVKAVTFAAAVINLCQRGSSSSQNLIAASSTNLYEITPGGSITDRNAHGLGLSPNGMVSDGSNVYLSSGTTNLVRKWTGAAYSTFSTTDADALEYLNNSLYGLRGAAGQLVVYDTAGTATTLFTWKRADGSTRVLTANAGTTPLEGLGGKLYMLIGDNIKSNELWIYDGSGVSLLGVMPENFYTRTMVASAGVLFMAGAYLRADSADATKFNIKPAVWYYSSGTLGKLWEAAGFVSNSLPSMNGTNLPVIVPFDNGVIFTDETTGSYMYYDLSAGGVSTVGMYTVNNDTPAMNASSAFFLHTRNATGAYGFPDATTTATTATVQTSLADFNSSLTKVFRGITIDADIPAGATVDVAYQIDALTGSYTSLATGVTSGTENTFGSTVTGRAISVKVTLNKGSSSTGPTLKRIYVRAAPKLQNYRIDEMLLDCTGRDGKTHVQLRDETTETKDGLTLAQNLITAVTSASPITVTDRFGTITAIIEADHFELDEIRPEEFIARVRLRSV